MCARRGKHLNFRRSENAAAFDLIASGKRIDYCPQFQGPCIHKGCIGINRIGYNSLLWVFTKGN